MTDCGIGIPVEDADRLFKAFFTTTSSGMGNGVAVRSSKGTAVSWATANIRHGATFQFTLPVNADAAS